jgi:hypothetical protein
MAALGEALSIRPSVPRVFWAVPAGILAVGAVAGHFLKSSAAANPDWASWTTLTPAARSALTNLRNPVEFRWHVVTLLVFVMYVYAHEINRARWNTVFAGLTVFGMDWFNELWNGLVLHFTRTSAMWTTPGHSALVVLPGWTIEIAFMFAIGGLVYGNMLHTDRRAKVLGLNNRWFWAIALSAMAVFVEVLLNRAGALVWHWWFWDVPHVGLIFLFGYLHFFVAALIVFDLEGITRKLAVVSTLYAIDAAATLVFVVALGWM